MNTAEKKLKNSYKFDGMNYPELYDTYSYKIQP